MEALPRACCPAFPAQYKRAPRLVVAAQSTAGRTAMCDARYGAMTSSGSVPQNSERFRKPRYVPT